MRHKYVLFALAIIPLFFIHCDRVNPHSPPLSVKSKYVKYWIPYKEYDTIKYQDSIGNELVLYGGEYISYYAPVYFPKCRCIEILGSCYYIEDVEQIKYELKDTNNELFFWFFMEPIPRDNCGNEEAIGRLLFNDIHIECYFPVWRNNNIIEKELVLDGESIDCFYTHDDYLELYFKIEMGVVGFKDKHGTLWKLVK